VLDESNAPGRSSLLCRIAQELNYHAISSPRRIMLHCSIALGAAEMPIILLRQWADSRASPALGPLRAAR